MLFPVLTVVLAGLLLSEFGESQQLSRLRDRQLGSFLPAELESRYRAQPCKVETGTECTLWVAGDQEARYVFFQPNEQNERLWRTVQPDLATFAVLPDAIGANAPQVTALAKRMRSDPDTFVVNGKSVSGKVQVIERDDAAGKDIMIVWMPEVGSPEGFETVPVTLVDAPIPQENRELNVGSADMIGEDSAGFVWFSAWENEIYRIDPSTDVAQPMTAGTATGPPDGMCVDSRDNVWYGAYNTGFLGTLSSNTPLTTYSLPYFPRAAAIPCEDMFGNIWITDHPYDRINEFNPFTSTFGRSLTMPANGAWVVQCAQDVTDPFLWMTLYLVDSLGRLDLNTGIIDRFSIPCSPAFLVTDARGIWATCWNNGNIVQLNPTTLTGRVYQIPGGSQAGGISFDPQGRIVFTENSVGRVDVLDPDLRQVYTYQLPSHPALKDGLVVARSGTIWAPAPHSRLVGKIVP